MLHDRPPRRRPLFEGRRGVVEEGGLAGCARPSADDGGGLAVVGRRRSMTSASSRRRPVKRSGGTGFAVGGKGEEECS